MEGPRTAVDNHRRGDKLGTQTLEIAEERGMILTHLKGSQRPCSWLGYGTGEGRSWADPREKVIAPGRGGEGIAGTAEADSDQGTL